MAPGFVECLGGIMTAPGRFGKRFFASPARARGNPPETRRLYRATLAFVGGVGLAGGIALTFFLLYPEVYMVPGSITSGPRLFVLGPTGPALLWGALALGIFLVAGYAYALMGSLAYRIVAKGRRESHDLAPFPPRKQFLAAYACTFGYTGLFHAFVALWIYFFERVNYAKVFFPVVDLTAPVVAFFAVQLAFLAAKWTCEYRLYRRALGCSRGRALAPVLVKLAVVVVAIGVFAAVSRSVAAQFA